MKLTKFYIPQEEDVAERVRSFLSDDRIHVLVNPHELTKHVESQIQTCPFLFVDLSESVACINADVVVIDDWNNCTRIEQATALEHVNALVQKDAIVILRYLDWSAFRHDGTQVFCDSKA